MSELFPFSPPQAKVIWLPSGEKDGCVSMPTKLVKGVIFKSDDAEERLNLKMAHQTTALMNAPNARNSIGCVQRLLSRLRDCGATIDCDASTADESAFSGINSFGNSSDIFRTSGRKR